MGQKRLSITYLAVAAAAFVLMTGFGICSPEPLEPVELGGGITFHENCEPYMDVIEQAFAYIEIHQDRMPYHPEKVVDVITGYGPDLLFVCEDVENEKVEALFGLTTYWFSSQKARIKISISEVLTEKWYHPLLGVLDTDVDPTVFFAAGIIAHEATHVVDYYYLGDDCSAEFECDLNQYNLWKIGGLLDDIISCYDNANRGCEHADNHKIDNLVDCLGEFLF